MTTDHITIEHNGHTATIEWREEHDGWRPSWWLHIAGHTFPIGSDGEQDDVAAEVREKYIGEPPPSDHASIWGGYTCSGCGAKGVRLWRDVQSLRCRACAERHEGKAKSDDSDSIGWSVPAVPTPDGSTFWGYTSVPLSAVDWWKALPEVQP